jgi:NAD+ synthase
MSNTLTITMAQLNPTVGDISGNLQKIMDVYEKNKTTSDLIAYTEMVVSGYPTDDLVLKPFFVDRVMQGVEEMAKKIDGKGSALLISTPWRDQGKVYNAALLIHDGKIQAKRFKHHLPNYGVFDEQSACSRPAPLPAANRFQRSSQLGLLTCEDMWFADVAAQPCQSGGAEILIVAERQPL